MKKILLVEDDSFLAGLCKSRLEAHSFSVQVAQDGQEGFYAIYEQKPDLVLLDLTLPQMDGVSLLGKVRAQKQFGKLPIFVLAENLHCDSAEAAMAAGASRCFAKSGSDMLDEILQALGERFPGTLKPHGHGTGIGSALPSSASSPQIAGSAPSAPLPPVSAPPSPARALPPRETPPAAPSVPRGSPLASADQADSAASDLEANFELKEAFQANYGATVHALRMHFVQLRTAKSEEERAAALAEFGKKIGRLRNDAVQCGIAGMAGLCAPLEALAKQLVAAPAKATPLTLQTMANGVDLLAAIASHLPEIDSIREIHPTALVVDDESVSRRATALALQKSGIVVTAVEGAPAALEVVESQPFDIIFLDVEMPGINGFALCARIRTLPSHKKTPVVFITALDDLKARASSKISGGNHFATKPINLNELSLTALTFIIREKMRV